MPFFAISVFVVVQCRFLTVAAKKMGDGEAMPVEGRAAEGSARVAADPEGPLPSESSDPSEPADGRVVGSSGHSRDRRENVLAGRLAVSDGPHQLGRPKPQWWRWGRWARFTDDEAQTAGEGRISSSSRHEGEA